MNISTCLTNQVQRDDSVWKHKKISCERMNCTHLNIDENMNCVNECTSKKCYEKIYSILPLEDGEIDNKRSRDFNRCLREEVQEQTRRRISDRNK
jgi:hypothetical protein